MAVGVALAACDGGTPGGSRTSGPLVSAPAQDARGSAEQQALDAYRGMWRAYAKAGLTANPDEPDLARYASGEALQILKTGLANYRSKGHVLKGEYVSNPQIAGASPSGNPTKVSIRDCLDDSDFLVYRTSGELINDKPGGRRSALATVSDFGTGGWKVTTFGVQTVGTC